MKTFDNISVKLGHALFFVLMLLSIVLYKERLFADASYYFFHAINKGWFHIEHGRTVLGISQLLPVIGTYFHLPLKVLMVLASLGHELFYYAIFLFCLYPLKDRAGAFAVLGIHIIGQLWLYYSPMLEICYGAALAVAFYSLLRSGRYKDDKYLVLLLFIQWFTMMSHPENFLLVGVAIVYDFIQRGFQKKIHSTVFAFTVLGFLLEVLTFSEYERGHTEIVGEENQASALNLLDSEYLTGFLEVFTGHYPDLLLLFGITTLLLLATKSWKKSLLFLASVLFLIVVVNQAAIANGYNRYNESMYNPLVFLVVFFFAHEIEALKKLWLKHALQYTLLAIVGIRIFWTYDFGEPLRKRSAQLERLVDYAQQLGHSKYLLNSENFHSYYTSITWANPIETLLYSAIDGKESSLSISTEGEYVFNNNYKILNDSSYMFRRFEVKEYDFLNPNYFQLKKERYQYLNNTNIDKAPSAYKDNFSIKLLETGDLKISDTSYFFVELENKNLEKLPSGIESGVRLSYHWMRENGEVYDWDGVRTNLEVDLFGKYQQHMKVVIPGEKGYFRFIPDIVVEGKMWFNLEEGDQVVVF
ncbi:MAG: hypothetical protein JKY48_00025 [Flavobacteriales bacterium]|nr:hypothetical protein [Flavobacteriales bacterium]